MSLERREAPRSFIAVTGFVTVENDRSPSGREGAEMGSTIWQCEQLRAGQVYNKVIFPTLSEAESFMKQMERAQPDIFWRMEAVPAATIWN